MAKPCDRCGLRERYRDNRFCVPCVSLVRWEMLRDRYLDARVPDYPRLINRERQSARWHDATPGGENALRCWEDAAQ